MDDIQINKITSEKNQHLSNDEKGVDIILDNDNKLTDDEKIDIVAARILKLYKKAFEELAK